MARFVSHTSASQNVDGKGTTGGNNVMERGGSVVANPIWEPAAPSHLINVLMIRSTLI
jgi:hypothetical protein